MSDNTINLNWITSFIWGIAGDLPRAVFVRGKYPKHHPPHDHCRLT